MKRFYLLTAFLLTLILVGGPDLLSSRTAGAYQVVHGWPILPDGFALGQVTGVEVDSHDKVFVFHRGARPILCFEGSTGKLLASWGEGMFGSAHGLTVDHEDNVWVTDARRHQVLKFSNDGKLLQTLGAQDVPGLDGKHFNKPTDVAVAPNGDIYVADGYGNSRIAKFDAGGKFLLDWGSPGDQPGQFQEPHGMTLDDEGRVYIADRGNSRVQVFTSEGKHLRQWKSAELGRPWGIAFSRDRFLYVADGGDLRPQPPDRGRVLRLDLDGRILEEWGSFGSYDGQFYWAHDVAVGADGDVYVTDVNVGMRVQKFERR